MSNPELVSASEILFFPIESDYQEKVQGQPKVVEHAGQAQLDHESLQLARRTIPVCTKKAFFGGHDTRQHVGDGADRIKARNTQNELVIRSATGFLLGHDAIDDAPGSHKAEKSGRAV